MEKDFLALRCQMDSICTVVGCRPSQHMTDNGERGLDVGTKVRESRIP